ncbi:MAG TPA: hypothetical protein DCQ87_05055 [Lachnospiraceae bacterium]|nr:hypothetical protein [Lachnospiraceae bacterium]
MDKATDFISLSEKYDDKNKKQELICLYQAAFYAQKHKDTFLLNSINNKISEICAEGYDVPGTSIVILSFNTLDYTKQCLESVKETVPLDRCQIVVVDNASSDGSLEYLRTLDWITLVENKENRGFPGGCNDGINVSFPENDIYLLNSDTILPKNALFWLKMGLYSSENVGSCGSMSNNAPAGQTVNKKWESVDEMISFADQVNVPIDKSMELRMFLIGFSVLIKRTVLEKTGLMDERFFPGNSEDIDISFRILKAGFVNVLCKNSFVIHFGNTSFKILHSHGVDFGELLFKNTKKLDEKLGFDGFAALRLIKNHAVKQIEADTMAKPIQILDLGCGMGSDATILETRFLNSVYTGIEEDSQIAAYASAYGKIITGSYLEINPADYFSKSQFDVILYSSEDDEEIVKKYSPYLKENGQLLNDKSRPILSISMLCNGGHKKETQKCLDSLMTIMNRLDSELIIVDTGCDKEMKSLISSYADKVIPFEWCDDFAKARNAGLRECRGKWFMYVDDDEWFDNTDELVSFFTSGEYRKYHHADYIQRNYIDSDGKNYDNFWVGRLTEIMDDTHFEGLIHEYLVPLTGEVASIHSFVHHYGYVYKDKQEHMAKARRNIKPLLIMLEKDPNNLHWYSQLVQEYMAAGQSSNLSDFCDNLIKQLDKIDDPDVNKIRADFYYGKLYALNDLCDYDKTIEDFNTFRKDRRNNDICMAGLYILAVIAYFEKRDYSDVINYGHKYLDLYDKWKKYDDMSERIHKYGSLTTKYVFSVRNVIYITGSVISAGIKEKETDELFRYFDLLSDLRDDGSQYAFVWGDILEAFTEFDYDQRFVEIADKFLSYDELSSEISAKAKEIESNDKYNQKTERLIKVFGQTKNSRNYYLDYLRLKYQAEYGTDRQTLLDQYKALILNTNDFFNLDKSVWYIASEKNIDLSAVFKSISLKKWYDVTDTYFDKHTEAQTEDVRRMMSTLANDDDIRFRFFRLKQREKELIWQKNSNGIIDYARECVDFYKNIYSQKQFEADRLSSMLPAQCQMSVNLLSAVKEKGYSERNKKLSECIGIYLPFAPLIKELIEKNKADKIKIIFLVLKSSEWKDIEPLWETVDNDPDSENLVIPLPYYEKKSDGVLGDYHFEKDDFPEKCEAAYFADVDFENLSPDVIFIFSQMDGNNKDVAVPAEFYASELQKHTKMLIFVPKEILSRAGMPEKIFAQVKEQLKK